jgi:hypothetical protein
MKFILIAAMLVLALQACGTGSTTTVNTATTGQQLMDIKKALDSGAITQQEYEQQRRQILNQ